MSGAALLRQWPLLERRLGPALLEAGKGRPPVTWSIGSTKDAVALVLAYEHVSGSEGPMRAFATDDPGGRDTISFGSADIRQLAGFQRGHSLSLVDRRWVPSRGLTDQVYLGEPCGRVDLVTVRAGARPVSDVIAQCRDRTTAAGQILVLDPTSDQVEPVAGFDSVPIDTLAFHLYRRSPRWTTDGVEPSEPAADPVDGRTTLAARSDEAARVQSHLRMARALARRFSHLGQPRDDLEQVAYLALLNASRRFDPSLNVTFATFASTSIQGELKRHFRDKTWSMRVPRPVQEMYLATKAAREELGHQLKATPSVTQIARHLGTTEDAVLEAMEAGDSYWQASLDAGPADEDPGTDVPVEDRGFERTLEMRELRSLLPRLDDRERLVIRRVYLDGCTQRTVAKELGVSQMQISRILSRSIDKLRRWAREQ